uniref:Uncharacterized protein n=1 Tax=Anguilla anguilla TaxID=7936 RepID=A0A0E9QGT8_ANGAN
MIIQLGKRKTQGFKCTFEDFKLNLKKNSTKHGINAKKMNFSGELVKIGATFKTVSYLQELYTSPRGAKVSEKKTFAGAHSCPRFTWSCVGGNLCATHLIAVRL